MTTINNIISIHNAIAMLIDVPTIESFKQAKSILIEKVNEMKTIAIAKVKMVMADSADLVDPSDPAVKRPIRGAIKAASLELLVQTDENGMGMSYDAILANVLEQFPTAKTSYACLRWYATKAKALGIDMPNRPRPVKSVKSSGKNIFKTIAAATAV